MNEGKNLTQAQNTVINAVHNYLTLEEIPIVKKALKHMLFDSLRSDLTEHTDTRILYINVYEAIDELLDQMATIKPSELRKLKTV